MKAEFYNNYPKGFEHPLKGYDASKPIVLKYLDARPDPDNPERILMPSMAFVSPTSQILIDDTVVHVAHVTGVEADGEAKIGDKELLFNRRDLGKWVLNPKVAKHRKQLEFLLLSSQNLSNKYRDPSTPPVFEIVDVDADAEKEIKSYGNIKKALDLVDDISEAERRELLTAATGVNTNGKSDKEVESQLQAIAVNDSKTLLSTRDKALNHAEKLIKDAVSANILKLVQAQHSFVWVKSEEIFCEYKSGQGQRPYLQAAEHLSKDRDLLLKLSGAVEIAQEG